MNDQVPKSLKKWEARRKLGRGKYILLYGVILWGGSVGIAGSESANVTEKNPMILSGEINGKQVPYGKLWGDFDKRPVFRAEAVAKFPPKLAENRTRGVALVSFTITKTGDTADVKVLSASLPEFGEAAKEAAKRNLFVPAMKAGKPTVCFMEILYAFPGPLVVIEPHR